MKNWFIGMTSVFAAAVLITLLFANAISWSLVLTGIVCLLALDHIFIMLRKLQTKYKEKKIGRFARDYYAFCILIIGFLVLFQSIQLLKLVLN